MATDELTPEVLAEGNRLLARSGDGRDASVEAGAWFWRHAHALIAAAQANAALRERVETLRNILAGWIAIASRAGADFRADLLDVAVARILTMPRGGNFADMARAALAPQPQEDAETKEGES